MNSRTRMASLLLTLLALPGAAAASEPPAAIDAMLSALGGREELSGLRSLAVEAHCTGPQGEFRTTVESLLPDSTYFAQSSAEGETVIWSTADRTWRRKADGAIEELSPDVRYFVRSHEFHLLLFQIEDRFANHEAAGVGEWNDEPCRLVTMEDESGAPASICISSLNDLPLYLELNPQGAEGPVRVMFEDWREVGGLRYFFAFTLTEGPGRRFTYDYERIEPDGATAGREAAWSE